MVAFSRAVAAHRMSDPNCFRASGHWRSRPGRRGRSRRHHVRAVTGRPTSDFRRRGRRAGVPARAGPAHHQVLGHRHREGRQIEHLHAGRHPSGRPGQARTAALAVARLDLLAAIRDRDPLQSLAGMALLTALTPTKIALATLPAPSLVPALRCALAAGPSWDGGWQEFDESRPSWRRSETTSISSEDTWICSGATWVCSDSINVACRTTRTANCSYVGRGLHP